MLAWILLFSFAGFLFGGLLLSQRNRAPACSSEICVFAERHTLLCAKKTAPSFFLNFWMLLLIASAGYWHHFFCNQSDQGKESEES